MLLLDVFVLNKVYNLSLFNAVTNGTFRIMQIKLTDFFEWNKSLSNGNHCKTCAKITSETRDFHQNTLGLRTTWIIIVVIYSNQIYFSSLFQNKSPRKMLTFGLICALVATASAGKISINNPPLIKQITYHINVKVQSSLIVFTHHLKPKKQTKMKQTEFQMFSKITFVW